MTDVATTGNDAAGIALLQRVRHGLSRAHRPLPAVWDEALVVRIGVRGSLVDLAGLTVVVAAVLATWIQPWKTNLRVPLRYTGDGLFYSMNVKTMIDTGWVQSTERLGAPFGQELYDFPIGGDNGNYLLVKVLTFFSGDFGLVLNTFYLLGFWSVAFATYLCARILGTSRFAAVVVSVLYTFAPYHFLRSGHVMLAHYAIVPIGVVVALRAATGRSFVRPDAPRWHPLLWIAACVAIGSFGAYYSVFALVTVAFTAIASALVNRSTRPVVAGAVFGAVIAVVMVLNQSGSLLYRLREGPNASIGGRLPVEFDTYSFRLIQTLTPVPGTRIPLIGDATAVLDEGFPSEDTMFFGLFGALCLLAMIVWVALRIVSNRFGADAPPSMNLLVAVAGLWILVAGTGGLSWFALLADFDRIRSWGRVSILILFVVLVWGARQITDLVRRRTGDSRLSTPVKLCVVAVVCVVGLADQVTPDVYRPARQWDEEYATDRDFFTQVEADLPAGASVAQLPIIVFPEARLNDSGPYDPVRGFLHTDTLRFSYGGMRGREADWQLRLADADTRGLVDAFLAFGFEAIVVDRGGYLDGGDQLLRDLTAITGRDVLASVGDKWLYVPIDRSMSDLSDADLADRRAELLASVDS